MMSDTSKRENKNYSKQIKLDSDMFLEEQHKALQEDEYMAVDDKLNMSILNNKEGGDILISHKCDKSVWKDGIKDDVNDMSAIKYDVNDMSAIKYDMNDMSALKDDVNVNDMSALRDDVNVNDMSAIKDDVNDMSAIKNDMNANEITVMGRPRRISSIKAENKIKDLVKKEKAFVLADITNNRKHKDKKKQIESNYNSVINNLVKKKKINTINDHNNNSDKKENIITKNNNSDKKEGFELNKKVENVDIENIILKKIEFESEFCGIGWKTENKNKNEIQQIKKRYNENLSEKMKLNNNLKNELQEEKPIKNFIREIENSKEIVNEIELENKIIEKNV